MKKWRGTSGIILALVAFFAAILPAPAWQCPMSGRIGDATFVCAGMSPQCVAAFAKCCHPVPLPRDEENAARTPVALLARAVLIAPTLKFQNSLPVGDLDFVLPNSISRPAAAPITARGAPIFALHLQNGSPSIFGRAPPFFA